jgi:hypothetical protein
VLHGGFGHHRRVIGEFPEPHLERVPAARGQFETAAELAVLILRAPSHNSPLCRLPAHPRTQFDLGLDKGRIRRDSSLHLDLSLLLGIALGHLPFERNI